jgi:hypothetical protein
MLDIIAVSSVLYISIVRGKPMKICDDTAGMNVAQREAYQKFWWAMVAYGAALPIAIALMKRFHAWPSKSLFMALPLAAVVLILRAMMAYFAAADEMQRRILSEGAAYTLVTTVLATIVCGFFEGTAIPFIPWWARFSFMMVTWGIAITAAKARYQ